MNRDVIPFVSHIFPVNMGYCYKEVEEHLETWGYVTHYALSSLGRPFHNNWNKGTEWTWVVENDERTWLIE